MDAPTLVGSLGVGLLLLAFFLNLFKFIAQDGFTYIGMNIAGAGLACWSSWMIAFVPFIVLEAVWCESEVQPTMVDVYISYLRQKLKQSGMKDPIQTRRGVGYRMVAENA